ncbi:50S ribosomal protein L25, partial [Pseudomonas aeruginosa]
MVDFILNAQVRSDLGKGASRRLRRNAGLVPAVVYGGDKEPQSVTLELREIAKLLENEAAFSHVIALNVGIRQAVPVLVVPAHVQAQQA